MPKAPLRISQGATFGRLTAESRVENVGGRQRWRFSCSCGGSIETPVERVISGRTLSCGCLRAESWRTVRQAGPAAKFKHGASKSLAGVSWKNMMNRCTNPSASNYSDYGGRGIGVCERWRNFDNFFADMGERPSRRHSIERIENDKGYEPGNCRWATKAEQQRNTRRSLTATFQGRTMTLFEIYARGRPDGSVTRATFVARVRLGWEVEMALAQPVRKNRRSFS